MAGGINNIDAVSEFAALKAQRLQTGKLLRAGVTSFILLARFLPLLQGQTSPVEIAPSTPLLVELLDHVPMKAGEALRGKLLYPVYVDNQLVLPAGTMVEGAVARLEPDRQRRRHARLWGDFTPFHTPIVRFNEFTLLDKTVPFVSDDASAGAPFMRLSPPSQKIPGSWIRRQVAGQVQWLKSERLMITAPGRWDRCRQLLYQQLPYHPERIEKGTAWTLELHSPLILQPGIDTNPKGSDSDAAGNSAAERAANPGSDAREVWHLRAYLRQPISSAHQRKGDLFEAMVTEPIFGVDHSLEVPEGAALVGEVTQAKPARSFGRAGKLRFHFNEIRLPAGFSRPVEGSLTGIAAGKVTNLRMDSEGGVQPEPQNRVVVPLLLSLLANRAFSDDGSQLVNHAVASNGFGIVGRVVGIVAGSSNLAAGIGFYASGLSVYEHWLTHGHDVSFAKYTRIEVTITPARSRLPVSDAPATSSPR